MSKIVRQTFLHVSLDGCSGESCPPLRICTRRVPITGCLASSQRHGIWLLANPVAPSALAENCPKPPGMAFSILFLLWAAVLIAAWVAPRAAIVGACIVMLRLSVALFL